MIRTKICGLKDVASVTAAAQAGAAYIGFNFFAPSPRSVTPAEAAALAAHVPPGIAKVSLTVDADDPALDAILEAAPIDMLQLHGEEPPERVAALRARHGLPVMKVISIADEADLAAIRLYEPVCDQILIDSKPPKGAPLPGGTGIPFDWRLIAGRRFAVPWMLAGGLTPANVAEAIAKTGAAQVDVASGVESSRGVKDPSLIRAFIAATKPAPVRDPGAARGLHRI